MNGQQLLTGIRQGNRLALSKAITLIESTRQIDRQAANQLINQLPHSNSCFRVGMSGPPGVGKSTFIESFGQHVLSHGHRLSVLAVDPSSERTGGSILGDKTRMVHLSRDVRAYIRPSPTRGSLGGVARRTMEALLLCEAAGYDMGFVETVGVGQSETMVADMVDMFVLLVPPAGGDELQGMKKGIMERVDLVLVNKADGDLRNAAVQAQIEYTSALKLAQSGAWKPRVLCVSSQEKNGLDEVYQTLLEFKEQMISSGELRAKRKNQTRTWMWKEVRETLVQRLMDDTSIQALAVQLEQSVTGGSLAPGVAADQLVDAFLNK